MQLDGADSFVLSPNASVQSNVSQASSQTNLGQYTSSVTCSEKEAIPVSPPIVPTYRKNTVQTCCVNARSISKKLDEISNIFEIANTDIAFFTETWETEELTSSLDEIIHMQNISWYRRPRPGSNEKRGGGAAIAVANSFGDSVQIFPANPDGIEITWAIVSPSIQPSLRILVASVYISSTTKYRPKPGAVCDHILTVINTYRLRYKNLAVIVGGDFNHEKIDDMEASEFKQLVDKPTRGNEILDLIISDLQPERECWVQKPVAPTDPRDGKPSDHSVPYILLQLPALQSGWQTIWTRKTYKKGIDKFYSELEEVPWEDIMVNKTVDEMVLILNRKVTELTDKYFPLKKKRVRIGEYQFFSDRLKKLQKKAARLYRREGNSEKFRHAKKYFKSQFHIATKNFFNNELDKLKGDPRSWHSKVQQLCSSDGRRREKGMPKLQCFDGLTDAQCAERVADHIESLTTRYQPIDLQEYRLKYPNGSFVHLTLERISNAIRKAKIPRTLFSTDPLKGVLDASREKFSKPLFFLFNAILQQNEWPSLWKVEEAFMIPKRKSPETLKDLRPISLTSVYSKILESIVRTDLNKEIENVLQDEQYGGRKNSNVELEIAGLMHEVSKNLEDPNRICIGLSFDMESAFNSMSHSHILDSAARLGVSHPIIRLLASYLTNRRTVVHWNDEVSSARPARGGVGQGTLLSIVLFLIAADGQLLELNQKVNQLESGAYKTIVKAYCDDLFILITFQRDFFPVNNEGKPVFQDDGRLHKYVKIIERFTEKSGMRLNRKKTNAVVFDRATEKNRVLFRNDSLQFSNGENINQVKTIKLVGFQITHDLKLDEYVDARRKSGMSGLWQLKKLASKGLKKEVLVPFYKSYIRSRLEFCVAAVYTSLNETQKELLESVQKKATKAILRSAPYKTQPGYLTYQERLEKLQLESLRDRWQEVFQKFALRIETDRRFQPYLKLNPQVHTMRLRNREQYHLPTARTDRHENSAIRGTIRLLSTLPTSRTERLAAAEVAKQKISDESTILQAEFEELERSLIETLDL